MPIIQSGNITAHPTGGGGHPNESRPPLQPPRPQPPPVTIRPKPESLDRRIRNLEALGNGVFVGNVLASYMALPGLVGFWPMSSVQRSTGNAYDLSGQGRTLTYNDNPAYTYYNGLVPYIDLDGTGDFLSRATETDLDIQGSETIFTTGAAGLTMGGWFWADATADPTLISKHDNATATNSSYMLDISSGLTRMIVYNASTGYSVSGEALTIGVWYFIVGRFVPSTSVDLWVNATKTSNTTSIAASLNATTPPFQIGARNSAALLNGRASMVFLCANALGDDLISSLFQASRVLFGI